MVLELNHFDLLTSVSCARRESKRSSGRRSSGRHARGGKGESVDGEAKPGYAGLRPNP
jgi:hypothetical protein